MPDKNFAAITEYRFDDRRLNLLTHEVWLGDELAAVEPKAFDLLVYLIAHRDRAIDKNELQDQIWPKVIVTEAALTRCVMKARRAIGDADGDTIATVRGHGYRFVREVEEITGQGPRSAKHERTDKPSLVVLPFVNISNDPQQEYFSDGITDDIITELSRTRSLFVIARPTAFSYKNREFTTTEIARELGVSYVVDGSVRRSGDRMRLNARLTEADSGAQLWAERYDRDISDVFVVQEQLATTIAATIGGRVEATRVRQQIDHAMFDSYDRLLRAQSLYYQFTKAANADACSILEQVIEIEPDNARALAILAAVHSMDSWAYWSENNEKSRRLSYELGKRSIELDDTDSLAQALFGEILYDCGEVTLSSVHFRRAIAINPNDIAARALYASKLGATGALDEAMAHIRVAEDLDPFGLLWIPLVKGSLLYVSRQYEDALEALYMMTSPPIEARLTMLACFGRLNRQDEAKTTLDSILQSGANEMPNYPGDSLDHWRKMINRMRGEPADPELEHFMASLRMAGWV